MKHLELEFVGNYDKCGDNKFTQIRREKNYVLYRRETMTGNVIGFELVKFKVVPAGAKLPGGGVVQEAYESYGGGQSFGKTAWFIAGVDAEKRAIDSFNAKVMDSLVKETDEILEELDQEDKQKQSVPVVKVEANEGLQFPSGKFTHTELADFNKKSKPAVYLLLQEAIKSGTVKLVGTRAPVGGRGKSSNVFEKA